jgi:sugar (pentulose or hexulose) kinase
MRVVVVIDVGTTSIKGSAVSLGGAESVVLQASSTPTPAANADGTHDALALLVAIEAAVGSLVAPLPADSCVALGFTTFVMNLVGVDDDGAPVTPLLTVRRWSVRACLRVSE